ncbi:MAG: DUF7507 domain-containing protein [Saccharofermentanales bacterium]
MKRFKIITPILLVIAMLVSIISMSLPVAAAEIAMAKNTVVHAGDPVHPTDVYLVGQMVHYEMSITNTSATQAMTIQITDTDPSGTVWYYIEGTDSFELAGPASHVTLDPLEVWEHDFHHILQMGDLYPHPVLEGVNIFTNRISADGTQGIDLIEATVTKTARGIQPEITVTKEADTDMSKVGDTINYTITIENTGDWALEGITVVDDILGDLSAMFADTLAVGASDTQVIPYVVPNPEPADPLVNIVTAEGVADGFDFDVVADNGPVVTDTATDSVDLFQPSITIVKTADTEISKVGDTVNYTITVTNTSSADSPNLMGTLVDAMLGLNEAIDLAPGEDAVFNVPYVVQAGDPDPLVNTATVTVSPDGFPNVLEESDTWTVDLFQPSINIDKTADTEISKVGDTVNYTITVTNTSSAGSPNLIGSVVDAMLGLDEAINLAPGESEVFNVPYVVQAGDPDPLVNTATVTVSPDGFPNVLEDSDSWTVNLFQPSITLVKTADTEISKAGDTVNYTITVTNTSSADSPNLIGSVVDAMLGLDEAINLAPGESEVFNVPYVLQAEDPDPLVNTATVTVSPDGFPNVLEESDSWTVDLFQPSINIDKTADTEISKVGDTVNYTITVTNTSSAGSPNLIGSVVDAMLGLDEAINLAPGESEVFNVPYVVQAGDPDPLVNTATVTVSPDGFPNVLEDSDSWTVDLVHPGISITKEADVEFSKVGDTVNYTIIVTNTGDVALINVDVTDSLLGDLWVDGTLAAGASMQFDEAYVVQAGDPEPLVNIATVTAGLTGLPNIIGPVQARVEVDLVHPGISLTKECDPGTGAVGDIITYTITIENTGDVDLENVTVTDILLGDLSASFVDYLAVGASDTQQFTRAIMGTDTSPLVNTATVDANVIILGNPVTASDSCEVIIEDYEGLTPGFWKNHPDLWVDYDPDDLVGDVFDIPAALSALADDTLMEALNYKGGSGAIGAARNLLRQAVAALLNASHPDVNYAMTEAEIIDAVNDALASMDREIMDMLKDQLDMYNNAGGGIDAHGNPIP